MKAALLLSRKHVYRAGLVEMVIWKLPMKTAERPHGLKYRLVYVVAGQRVVGYDNEAGKGDHRHIGGQEMPYRFVDVQTWIADFFMDVEKA